MDEQAPPEPVKSPSGNRLLLIVMLANLLAVTGVGGYVVLTRGEGRAHAAERTSTKPPRVGPVVAMEPLIVNIAPAQPGDEERFLKVTVQLEAKDELAKQAVEAAVVPIRHRILVRMAGLSLAETRGAGNLLRLQNEIRSLASEAVGAGRIRRVYFTEFVVQ